MLRPVRGAGLAALVAAVALPATASAQEVSACNTTVTEDAVVTQDLTCAGPGVIIGAGDVTLDLQGFSLRGNGTSTGVANTGFPGVTVRNGRIANFGVGVSVKSSANNGHLDRLRVIGNATTGISVTASTGVFITASRVSANGQVGIVYTDDLAIAPSLGGITGSTVTANGSNGILVATTAAPTLGMKIQGNTVGANNNGISLIGTSQAKVNKNTLAANNTSGIAVLNADQTKIASNTISGSQVHGIEIGTGNTSTVVSGNRATYSRQDGINNKAVDTTFTGNVLKFNRDLGIDSVSVITAATGNVAKDNGNPAQCTGVPCSS